MVAVFNMGGTVVLLSVNKNFFRRVTVLQLVRPMLMSNEDVLCFLQYDKYGHVLGS